VLTVVTVPKPFRGHIGDIQRNAIESWRALRPDVQIVLVGDDEGVQEAAEEAQVEHVSGLAMNERGTPRLDSAFELAATVARWPLWCLVNADVVLLDDFPKAIERVASSFDSFVMIGECRDLAVGANAQLSDASARADLRGRALARGRLRGWAALDYFVFRRGLFDPLPPFLIGRACFDNWLVWRARERGHPVIDATRSVVAVHQSHDYSHVPGGLDEAYYGEEARYNEQLAGGADHIYSLHDATHRLYQHGPPIPFLGSIFRMREKARLAKVSIDIRRAARRARREGLGEHPVRMLAVVPEPCAKTSMLLDALAAHDEADLTVVYATKVSGRDATSNQPLRHVHGFARSIRIAALDRVLGRPYPITPTIWHSFYFVGPDCMLISGWATFSAQAAIGWCLARRLPYLLLIDQRDKSTHAATNGKFRHIVLRAVARHSEGVLVRGQALRVSVRARGVPNERIKELTGSGDAAAARVVVLARNALDDPTPPGSADARAGYRLLSHLRNSVRKRAQTPRSRSASPHRRR
jgi:hypothetical protein